MLLAPILLALVLPAEKPEEDSGVVLGLQAEMVAPRNIGFGVAQDFGYGGAFTVGRVWPRVSFDIEFPLRLGPGPSSSLWIDAAMGLGLWFTVMEESPITPIVGAGLSLHWLSVSGPEEQRVLGSVFRTDIEQHTHYSAVGGAVRGGAGVRFYRRLAVIAEYEAIFLENTPQALIVALRFST